MQAMGEIKGINHLKPFSFHTLGFEEGHLCFGDEREKLKPFKFKRSTRALRRSPRRPKDGGI